MLLSLGGGKKRLDGVERLIKTEHIFGKVMLNIHL